MKKSGANVYDIKTRRPVKVGKAANDAAPEMNCSDHSEPASDGKSQQSAFVLFIRHFTVMILMWLRGPIRFILSLFGIPALFALAIVAIGLDPSPEKTKMLFALGAVSFGSFSVRWLYDGLVMKISPEPLYLNS